MSITDNHGAITVQYVTIAIDGSNDAPTAVNDNVITDVGPSGAVDNQPWMLAANDTDPDTTDHLSVNSVGGRTGGNAVQFGDAFFIDDATPGLHQYRRHRDQQCSDRNRCEQCDVINDADRYQR